MSFKKYKRCVALPTKYNGFKNIFITIQLFLLNLEDIRPICFI